jgi:membrane protein YdbS with pleckstrin-like domain
MLSYFKQELNEGEELITILRKHRITLSWFFLKIIIVFVLAMIFFRFAPNEKWSAQVFLIWIFLGFIYSFRGIFVWLLDCYIITNERIIDIDQRGFFQRIVTEVSYGKIQNAFYEIKGPLATFFNYGNIKIQIAQNKGMLLMKQIPDPKKIQDIIIKFQEKSQAENTKEVSASELVKYISEVKKNSCHSCENGNPLSQ